MNKDKKDARPYDFKKDSQVFIGYKNEDTDADSDSGTIKRCYYFEKTVSWETLLLNYASKYFKRGDKVFVENTGGKEKVETTDVIFRRSGNKFTVQLKSSGTTYEIKNFIADISSELKELRTYEKKYNRKDDVVSLYENSRKGYDPDKDLTGYWFVKFDNKIKAERFCLDIKKEARTNKSILNYYMNKTMNMDREFVVRIYCLDKGKMKLGEFIKASGIITPIQYELSLRSMLKKRKIIVM